jgi:hypothetical protein
VHTRLGSFLKCHIPRNFDLDELGLGVSILINISDADSSSENHPSGKECLVRQYGHVFI